MQALCGLHRLSEGLLAQILTPQPPPKTLAPKTLEAAALPAAMHAALAARSNASQLSAVAAALLAPGPFSLIQVKTLNPFYDTGHVLR